jgi:molybdopterin-guanine dinucleotide biosynthesis protein A
MRRASGLLLTGGSSRRLGVDKATLVVDGTTLAVRGAAVLQAVCEVVVEVGPGVSGLPAVREDPPGAGPLAALAAGAQELARRSARDPVILLAVDLPRVTTPLLELLRDWPGEPTVVPAVDGRLQLVCARYGVDALIAAGSLLTAGISSLRGLLDVIDHDVVDEHVWGAVATADVLADVDTLYTFDRGILAFAPEARGVKISEPPTGHGPLWDRHQAVLDAGDEATLPAAPPSDNPE